MLVLDGGVLTILTQEQDRPVGGSKKLLTRIGPTCDSNKLATVYFVGALALTDLKARYVGF